jgi:hypothetical protein
MLSGYANTPIFFKWVKTDKHNSLIHFSKVFSAATPFFRCRIPGCDAADAMYAEAFEKHYDVFAIPPGSAAAQCHQFRCRSYQKLQNMVCKYL